MDEKNSPSKSKLVEEEGREGWVIDAGQALIRGLAPRAMLPMSSLDKFKQQLRISSANYETEYTRMLGLLFARPSLDLTKKDIIPNLEYFNLRSGNNIDLHCVGYDDFLNPKDNIVDDTLKYKFNMCYFLDIVSKLEEFTSWEYSGSLELILLNVHKKANKFDIDIDFSSTVVCDLEKMIQDKAIYSVKGFFEEIFRYSKEGSSFPTTTGFSKKTGLSIAKSTLLDSILSILPKDIAKKAKQAKYFAIRNIGKNGNKEVVS